MTQVMSAERKRLFEDAQKRACLRQYLDQKGCKGDHEVADLALALGVLEKGLKKGEKAVLNRYR